MKITLSKVILIGGIILFLLGILFTILHNTQEESNNLDCYDNYGNVINGVTCSGIENSLLKNLALLFLLFGLTFMVVGLIGVIVDDN